VKVGTTRIESVYELFYLRHEVRNGLVIFFELGDEIGHCSPIVICSWRYGSCVLASRSERVDESAQYTRR
jgi:hypothetical protein